MMSSPYTSCSHMLVHNCVNHKAPLSVLAAHVNEPYALFIYISRGGSYTESDELPLGCSMKNKSERNKMHTNELSHALTDFQLQHFHLIFFFQLQLHFIFFPVANRAAPSPDARSGGGGRTHTMESIKLSCVTRMENQFNNLLHLACEKRQLTPLEAARSNFCEKRSNAPLYCVQRNDRFCEE